MTEGLPLYSPAPPTQRQPPDPDPDPVETELGAAGARTETSLATRGIIRARLVLLPKELLRRQQELERISIPRPWGSPPEQPSPAPRPDSHTQGWESRHPAPETSGARPTRAWSRRVGSGRVGGDTWIGVGGVAWPKLSPVGGLGPAAARKTDFRRLF